MLCAGTATPAEAGTPAATAKTMAALKILSFIWRFLLFARAAASWRALLNRRPLAGFRYSLQTRKTAPWVFTWSCGRVDVGLSVTIQLIIIFQKASGQMSAVGLKVGVISLGMSCQSSAQIRAHVPLLSRLTGDDALKKSAMPFDNIICRPDSAASVLQADIFYPDDPNALLESEGARWKDFGVYFWHEYRLHKHHVLEYTTGRLNKR